MQNETFNVWPSDDRYGICRLIFGSRETLHVEREWKSFSHKYGREELVGLAKLFLNAPLPSGVRSFLGLEMDSLVHLLYKQAGYIVPSYLSGILGFGKRIDVGEADKGDLVIFSNKEGVPDRLGMYLREAQMLEMRGKVVLSAFDPQKALNGENNSTQNQVYEIIKLLPL